MNTGWCAPSTVTAICAATLFSTEEEVTLADTPESVERQLKALFGYYYGAFSKAFFWGQQSSGTKEGDSDNLRAMAGLKEHASLSGQLEREQQERLQTLKATGRPDANTPRVPSTPCTLTTPSFRASTPL